MVVTAGAGRFISWNGGCLFIGSSGGVVPLHAHYSIQVAFGSEHGIAFRASEQDEWTSFAGGAHPQPPAALHGRDAGEQ